MEALKTIVSKANLSNALKLRNTCMYSLAFSGLLRFDDLIRIRRNDLVFHDGYLKIKIIKSKNDQLRQGNEVLISESDSLSSPTRLLKLYLERLEIPEDGVKYLFRPLSKTKLGHRLISQDRHICYTTFREALKSDLTGVVDNPSAFGTHSLRAGGATLAANSGINDRILQRHGRWRSVSAKDGYIDDDISKRLEVSKCFDKA